MVIDRAWSSVSAGVWESVTLTVKLESRHRRRPEITPPLESESPTGSEPRLSTTSRP